MTFQKKIEITGLAIGLVMLGNGGGLARADDASGLYDAYGTYTAQLTAELANTQAALTSCASTDTACRTSALAQKEILKSSIAAMGAAHVASASDTLAAFNIFYAGMPARVTAIHDAYKICKATGDATDIPRCQAIAKAQEDQLHADELQARRAGGILADETVQKLKADLAACQSAAANGCLATMTTVDSSVPAATPPVGTTTTTTTGTGTLNPLPLDSATPAMTSNTAQ